MTIHARLRIAAAAPLMMALVAGLALGLTHRAVHRNQQRARAVAGVIRSINDLNSLAGAYLLYFDERPRQQFLAEHESAARLLDSIDLRDPKQKQLLDGLRDNVEVMTETFRRIVATHERFTLTAEPALHLDRDRLAGHLLVRTRQAVADGLRLETLVRGDIDTAQRTANLLVYALIVAVCIPITLALARTMGAVTRSLATLHRGTDAIGRGDLTHRIDMPGEDELADLARSFDEMTGKLQAVTVSRNELRREVEERQRAETALRESERKYRDLFVNMTEEVHFWKLVLDANGQIETWRLVDANPPTLRTWGKTLDQIKGKTTDEIFGPGATGHYLPIVRKIMTEGVPYSYEDFFPNVDKHFRFTSIPMGEYFITTGADITAQKRAADELRKYAAEVEAANASLRDSGRAAMNLMRDAVEARHQAEKAGEDLSRSVDELKDANEELARFNRAAVGRELRMIELKKQINEMCSKAGLPARYKLEAAEEKESH